MFLLARFCHGSAHRQPKKRAAHRAVPRLEELEDRAVPALLGQQLFPADNPWNQKITNAPVAANSTAIINNVIGLYGNGRLHPDFGQDSHAATDLYGIPYNVVHGNSTPKTTVVIDAYAGESDRLAAPVPSSAVLEGDFQNGPKAGVDNRGDSHLLVFDVDNNVAYEFYRASRPSENADGRWHADQETVWDMKADTFRTLGWTSADAAGLSILTGLVRPDEGLPASEGGQGAINHAIRFTLQNNIILDQFLYPASHTANPGNSNAAVEPPMGARFRLKAGVDISQLNPESRVIAQAMKDYGMIVADNGSNFFFSGASYAVDASNQQTLTWNDNDIQDSLHGLKSLHFSDYEVVDLTPAVTDLSVHNGAAGASVTVTGHNFSGAAGHVQVLFGNTPATSVTVVDDGHVTAEAPAGTGTVDVRIQSGLTTGANLENYKSPIFGYGVSSVTAGDRFTFGTTNQPPVANGDSYAVNEDAVLSITMPGVLSNDTDVDGNLLSAFLVAGPLRGALTLNSNGAFNYAPSLNVNGTDSFSYQANDGTFNSNTVTVTIVVNAVNDAPVANNDTFSVFENQTLSVAAGGVLGNDTDVDPGTGQTETLTAILVAGGAHGTVTLRSNGAFTYLGSLNFQGTDSFTYAANDGSLGSSPATVTLVIGAVDNAPVAVNDLYSVFENQTLSISAPGVLGNDSDIDSPTLTAVKVTGPAHGTLTLSANGALIYIPSAFYSGTDSFTYVANDGVRNSNVASVTVTVVAVNQAPVAGNNALSVFENQVLMLGAPGVLNNDSDANSPVLTALLEAGPVHGTLTLNANGALRYTPSVFFNGSDSFTYKANDGFLNSNLATVSITVVPVNQAPVANNDAYSLFEDFTLSKADPGVLANDTDIDGPALTALLVSGPAHGTLSFNANGAYSYVPNAFYNGTDSFTYKANDGLVNSNLATVKITVIAVNHAPVANSDSYSVFEDSALSTASPGVLRNDSDIDGNSLTSVLVASPAHGTVSLRANGSFAYTPATHYNGADSFTYRANDGALNSTVATVSLNVIFFNHAPVANNDAYTVHEESSLVVAVASGVLANDTDVENAALTALLVASPVHGALALQANGAFIYTPSSGYFGTDSFRYRANDGSLNSATATVTLTVTDVSSMVSAVSSPVANNHDGTFTGTITITNRTAATDIDGPLVVVLTNLTSGVTLHNKTGDTPAGNPYITIPAGSLPGGKLGHGQSIQVTVVFDDPLALSINYVTKTLSGPI